MKIEELKEGCGKNIDWETFGDIPIGEYVCGEDEEICSICEAKLKTLQERNAEVKKAINNFENKLRNNHFIMTEELLKELLQKLGLSEEGK